MWKRFDPARPLAVIVAAVLAGVVAGLLASVLLTFTAEPVIDRAIALEAAHHRAVAPNEATDPEIVARSTQRGAGRFAAYGLAGGAYGALLGIAFLALRRRSQPGGGPEDTLRRALVAGAVLAGALTVMPFLKYPPNPPGVGEPSTLAERQWKYLALIFLSVVILAAAARLSGWLRERGWFAEARLVAVALAAGVPLGVLGAALPANSDPIDMPAKLLWQFRIASLSGNLLLWAVLTAGFGAAAVRRERELARPVAEGTAGGAFRPATSA
jgi:predicted cobalt transporter CbtA